MILRAKLYKQGVLIKVVTSSDYNVLFSELGKENMTDYDEIFITERQGNVKTKKAAGLDWLLLG